MRSTKYTREVLEPIVKSSRSLAEVMRKLGLRTTGGNYRRTYTSFARILSELGLPEVGRPHHELKARIRSLGLDTSHFTGRGWSRGKTWRTDESLAGQRRKRRLKDEQVFVENSPLYAGPALIPRLLDLGWPYECAWCGLSEWRGMKLVLHLDHANGIHNDNRLANLRLLCPNCHTQTETYSNRRRD